MLHSRLVAQEEELALARARRESAASPLRPRRASLSKTQSVQF